MAVDIGAITGGSIKTVALAAPADQGLRDVVLRLFGRLNTAMPWLPYQAVGIATVALDQQSYPFPLLSVTNPPAWLSTPDHLEVWRQVAGQFTPLTQSVLAGQMQQAQAQGVVLDRNVAFWDAVAKYSGSDALQSVWDDLWRAVASFKAQREATKLALDTAQGIIASYGVRVPADLTLTHSSLIGQYNALSTRAQTALAPLGAQAKAAAGLGIAPLVIAGIATASIITITASIWAIAAEFTSVQRQANANAQALLQWRESADQADFAAGKITNDQLMLRRGENINAAKTLVDSEGAAAVGAGFGKAGVGIAAAVGAIGLVGLAAYLLMRKKSA